MWRATGVLLGLSFILAGCFGGTTGDEDPTPDLGPMLTWTYECPPPPVRQSQPGVCVQTIGGPESFTGEPHVALHPSDGRILAVGVNRIGAYAGMPPGSPLGITTPGLTYGLFVSEDAGAGWRTPAVPTLPGTVHLGDPNIAFDDEGTLHVTGLFASIDDLSDIRAFHVATRDLGRSWTPISEISDARGADRQWITIHGAEIYVSYQKSSIPASFVAHSADRGANWDPLIAVERCNLNSEVLLLNGTPLLACTDGSSEVPGVRIVRINLGEDVTDVARLPLFGGFKRLVATTQGEAILVLPATLDGRGTIFAYRSTDGGTTWPVRTDLGALTPVLDDWDWSWVSWATMDVHDRLHVLATGGTGPECVRGACEDEATRRIHLHLIFDTATDRLEHVARVSPTSHAEGGRALESSWAGLGDEASGIACAHDRCVLAWGWDKSVDWTIVRTP
jgi:hypothetical protein